MEANNNKDSKKSVTEFSIVDAIKEATIGYRHAEIIVQSRLYNYLVAATILFLSWSSLYGISHLQKKGMILSIISILGVVLSVLWVVLGTRQRKFLDVHMDIIQRLEKNIAEDYAVTRNIAELQDGNPITLSSGRTVMLCWAERKVRSRNLIVICPNIFAAAFFVLLIISVCQLTTA